MPTQAAQNIKTAVNASATDAPSAIKAGCASSL